MAITKEELITIIKANTELDDDKLGQIAEKIKGSMMEEFNEKLTELTKVQENKMTKIDQKDEGKPKWNSFGEQLKAVAVASTPNNAVDKRLVTTKDITGANETIGSEGGFLIDPEYSKEILTMSHETGIIAKDCRHLSIAGNRLVLKAIDETSRAAGSRWGGIRGYWVSEGTTATASQPKFRQIGLDLNKLEVVMYATEELLQDAPAITGLSTQGVGEEFGFLLDDAIINGTGAGQPMGILNCSALVSQAAEGGQVADTVVAENISKMYNRMPASNRVKAKWYIIQDVEPQIFQLGFKLGTSAIPVFVPPGQGFVNVPNGTLLGRPIQPLEQCAALGDVGDIILADMSQYLIIEKAGGIQASSSIHVRFLYDEQVFKFVMRCDGQPLWNSAVTSYKGSVTRSPYVALAAR